MAAKGNETGEVIEVIREQILKVERVKCSTFNYNPRQLHIAGKRRLQDIEVCW